MVQPLWKTVWWFLTKLSRFLLYDPAIVLLGIYVNDLKICVSTKTCTQILIVALFIIAKTWKQLRCPSVGAWINKLWPIQTMEYYSALKTSQLSRHEKTWRNLKCTLLSERANLKRLHTI